MSKRALQKRQFSVKETYNLKEPTRSLTHPHHFGELVIVRQLLTFVALSHTHIYSTHACVSCMYMHVEYTRMRLHIEHTHDMQINRVLYVPCM